MLKKTSLLALIAVACYSSNAVSVQADTFIKALHYNDFDKKYTDEYIKDIFLVHPDSEYSNMNDSATWLLNDITWQSAWSDFRGYYNVDPSETVSLRLLAKEAGFTKARPLIEFSKKQLNPGSTSVPGSYFYSKDSLAVRANVVKAQIDPDIYYKAWSLFTVEDEYYSFNVHALISKFALAVQIVRDKSQIIKESDWRKNGIYTDVIKRFLNNTYRLSDISESDKEYLMAILNGSIKSVVNPYKHNRKYLKTQYRLARLSAALVDRMGYFVDFPCTAEFKFRGTQKTRNQCFVDMTDKGLWNWYTEEFSKAITPKYSHDGQQHSFLASLLDTLLPLTMVMDGLSAFEFFTASEAAELGAEGLWEAEEVEASQEAFLTEFCEID
ncbi:hypothetical protein [Vibrio sp. AND4]|uniref:hypothetical protein n=1 Tax=Vibrio sp. AND4 TaxID=314289 RepID=UPI00015EFB26|nr:hypothetical protein [Vibrio sp. AND4]EDP60160.1 hypothetical protein AND4_02088 [Vibrio sp. AND4]